MKISIENGKIRLDPEGSFEVPWIIHNRDKLFKLTYHTKSVAYGYHDMAFGFLEEINEKQNDQT